MSTFDEQIEAAKQIARIRNEHTRRYKFLNLDENEKALRAMMDRMNPRFPTDSIKFDSICECIANGKDYNPEEQEIVESLLPDDFSGSWSKKVRIDRRGVSPEYFFSAKKSGWSYLVTLSDISFPIKVDIQVYADMDDLANHGDYCPLMLPEDHPEWSDDCHCETYETHSASITIDDNKDLEKVRDFIEENRFGKD